MLLQLPNTTIEYELKKSLRARRLRLVVSYGGKLTAVVPKWMTVWEAENFLRKKAAWILKNTEKMAKYKEPLAHFKTSKKEYKQNRQQALSLILQRVNHYNKFYNFPVGRVSVRNTKSR